MTLIPNDYQKEVNKAFEISKKEIDALKAENKKLNEQLRLHSVSVSLLERAATLVGNPATNISGSTDLACDEWQKDYERWRSASSEVRYCRDGKRVCDCMGLVCSK